ncbi:hypothetical protein HMPREF1981_02450 [Bacteroides pyogenes F0041]|uniref:PBP domain-containing protein n=1 Tax=Bacteroides pyogenes F0041 TaxID=1321819 RepID=U2DWD9_9BACE|nr:substrate-binding domain-containing protein [Bacteroides pyogenes]ERI84141.1 hypothetical protein HMPREF1981_02450 [Bacteroides pyogenes F0041]MBB3893834.1 phosphate transport system substrate-binding protein [Bacteroides pyogenes]SUV33824.1 phosphate ABC transporter substrate-binding protein, PhoT family [Bacteroides pyogenes]
MMKIDKRIITMLLLFCTIGFVNCNNEEENVINYENSIEGLTADNFPVMDSSTSTHPLLKLLGYKLMGIRYKWEVSFMSGIEKYITCDSEYYYGTNSTATNAARQRLEQIEAKMKKSTTHGSFVNLIDDKVELIIASRAISRDEKQYAKEKGTGIIEKPVGIDGFVFIKNKENPVKSLTCEQIRSIYSGKITNWKEVGGNDVAITPYMRNRNSGSQEKMETLVMKGEPMMDAPELVGGGMTSPFYSLWENVNGMAYTPYYYCTAMIDDPRIKMFDVEGVQPDKTTIASRQYPYVSEIYAAVRADVDKSSMSWKIFEFLTSGAANAIIEESGYVKYY